MTILIANTKNYVQISIPKKLIVHVAATDPNHSIKITNEQDFLGEFIEELRDGLGDGESAIEFLIQTTNDEIISKGIESVEFVEENA